MPQPLVAVVFHQEDSPPQMVPSGPYPVPVHGQAQNRPGQPVFGDHRCNVRVMMLDRQSRQVILGKGPLGAEVVRMYVMDDVLGFDLEDSFEVIDGPFKGTEGLEVLQISDVLAQEGFPVSGQTDGALEFGATPNTDGTESLRNTGTGT